MSDEPFNVDSYVGAQIHVRRKRLGMTQEQLGETIGATLHQMRRYEGGVERVGAHGLSQIARVLGVPVSFFFPGIEDDGGALFRGLATSGSADLLASYASVADPDDREVLLELLKAVAAKSRQSGTG